MTPSYLQMIQKQPEGKLTLAPRKQNLKTKDLPTPNVCRRANYIGLTVYFYMKFS